MATYNKLATTGVHIWWRSDSPRVWIELGPDKTTAFLGASNLAKAFLLLIPIYGPALYALGTTERNAARAQRGPNGIWIRFPTPRIYRPRTEANKRKAPSPW